MTHTNNTYTFFWQAWIGLIGLFLFPQALTAQVAYVSSGSHLDVIDLAARKTIFSVPLMPGVQAGAVVANPDGRHVYVADGNRVAVIDVPLYSLSYIDMGPVHSVRLQVASPDGRRLYASVNSLRTDARLVAIDTTTGQVLPVPFVIEDFVEQQDSDILAFLPDGSRFFSFALLVADMDSTTGKQLSLIQLEGTAGAISPDGSRLYLVRNYDGWTCDSNLTIVNTATDQIALQYPLGKDVCPKKIALSPDGARAYLADSEPFGYLNFSPKIRVLDLKTMEWLGEMEGWPSSMALADDGKMLVTAENNGDSGAIRIIDTAQIRLVDTVPTAERVNSFALAPTPPLLPDSPLLDGAAFLPLAVRGGIASIFGSALARGTQQAGSIPLPKSLLETAVTLDGIDAPLILASAGQINLQIPWELPAGPVSLQVRRGGLASEVRTITITDAAPGIFVDSQGRGAIFRSDAKQVTSEAPARAGEILTIMATGLGPVKQTVVSGDVPSSAVDTVATVRVTIGGVSADVLSARLSTTFPGLYEVHVSVTKDTPAGDGVSLFLSTAGHDSNKVTISVVR